MSEKEASTGLGVLPQAWPGGAEVRSASSLIQTALDKIDPVRDWSRNCGERWVLEAPLQEWTESLEASLVGEVAGEAENWAAWAKTERLGLVSIRMMDLNPQKCQGHSSPRARGSVQQRGGRGVSGNGQGRQLGLEELVVVAGEVETLEHLPWKKSKSMGSVVEHYLDSGHYL
jgi:hypothetical protein